MLTSRGWWFLLTALTLTALAALIPPRGHVTLAPLGLALLGWFLAQWLLFVVRVRRVVEHLVVVREVHDDRGSVENLWAGRTFAVKVRVHLDTWLGLPHVRLSDRVPSNVELGIGETLWEGELKPGTHLELEYVITCGRAGLVRFEGVKVQLADLQGFFYHAGFLSDGRICRVLPMLVDAEGRGPTTKRHNLLPPPGVHRLRRPGSGSELLDLRDYMPGDPPKTIAWKVSARRDRLITKEFETEVPVRCTLFVDTSNSVRLGPPGNNALTREVEIAAAVAQATVGARDLVGLCLFDEETTSYAAPGRTPRHLIQVLNRLADAAGLAATQGKAPVDDLLPLAYSFAEEVYPHLLRRELNSFPWWLPWWAPQQPSTRYRPTAGDYLYGLPPWFVRAVVLHQTLIFAELALFNTPTLLALTALPALLLVWNLTGSMVAAVIAAVLSPLAVWLIPGVPLFTFLAITFRRRRRHARWRKLLSAVLSVRHGLAPAGVALLQEDDEKFSAHVQRFLAEHHVPYDLPLYNARGRFLFASPGKVEVLAKALLRAVSHSHDNELFVLIADLLELTDDLGPVLRAVKVASARHHQVMVICPWPPGVPAPQPGRERGFFAHLPFRPVGAEPVSLTEILRQSTTVRYHDSFARLRRTFARIGVPVLCAQAEDAAPLIVERLDQLRAVRFRHRPS